MRSFVLAAVVASLLTPLAHADGRNPGSVLIFPVHRSGPGFFTVLSVTNTNTLPIGPTVFGGSTIVNFEYANSVFNPANPFEPCGCIIFNRKEFLTPADTLSVLTNCHNAVNPGGSSGFVTITAQDPSGFDVNWSHNNLIGSELVVNASGGMYSLNAIPFDAVPAAGQITDVGTVNGEVDFDGAEYEGINDVLFIDTFLAIDGSSLSLLNLTGSATDRNTVQIDVWNDNEFPLSTTLTFTCWFDQPLSVVSPLFTSAFLAGVPNDPAELDITCNGNGNIETGWAQIQSINVSSQGGNFVTADGAIVGAITAGPAQDIDGAHLLWGRDVQLNGATPNGSGFVSGPCGNLPPVCQILVPGPATIMVGETFSVDYLLADPNEVDVLIDNIGPPGAVFMPPSGPAVVPINGNVSWTPGPAFAGTTQIFQITIIDGFGASDTCQFQVEVEDEPVNICANSIHIDFNEDLGGGPLPAGTNVTNQYFGAFGFMVSAVSDSNEAWIFNSSIPEPGDLDLGTPNGTINGGAGVVPGGPGVGNGPGAGVNNDTDLGNVLILQNDLVATPNDDPGGGVMTVSFLAQPVAIQSFKIVDAEEAVLGHVRAYDALVGGNLLFDEPINGIGDNSVQTKVLDQPAFGTRRLEIELNGSGALGEFTYCIP